ncbi:hypothetical protein BLA29_006687 [Euroglyphus maynei]|uniref:Uncharacterized protein n=1 Tax=Euroglyphus maynei TaxID=6958 RepID=A0A1Y3B3I3_EURMA|nr:hypothetical protein BLA29_006687 [Euroglyphus maynei]
MLGYYYSDDGYCDENWNEDEEQEVVGVVDGCDVENDDGGASSEWSPFRPFPLMFEKVGENQTYSIPFD